MGGDTIQHELPLLSVRGPEVTFGSAEINSSIPGSSRFALNRNTWEALGAPLTMQVTAVAIERSQS